jgi:hypothetical protein
MMFTSASDQGAFLRPAWSPTAGPYERMKSLLRAAHGCFVDVDRATATGALDCALQRALEATAFACEAVLVTAELDGGENSSVSARLEELLASVRPYLDLRWRPRDLVDWAYKRINAFTKIDMTNAEARIESARRFVLACEQMLTEVLPRLAECGLEGWNAVPPEDPSGGAYWPD